MRAAPEEKELWGDGLPDAFECTGMVLIPGGNGD
jgi:hypothetical protein